MNGMPRRPARTSQREPDRRHRPAPLRPVVVAAVEAARVHPDWRKKSVPVANVQHADHETWVSILVHDGRPPVLSIGRFECGVRIAFVVLDERDLDAVEAGIAAYRAARAHE